MAKKLFDKKGFNYSEINVASKPELRLEMMQQTNRRTVPQIFINDFHVGGFSDLHALEMRKELDPLLVAS
jgi:glutaredoxin 3